MVVDDLAVNRLEEIIRDISTERFAKEWSKELKVGLPNFKRITRANQQHEMILEEDKLYSRLGRRWSAERLVQQ